MFKIRLEELVPGLHDDLAWETAFELIVLEIERLHKNIKELENWKNNHKTEELVCQATNRTINEK